MVKTINRFDNITDEDINEGIVKNTKNKSKKWRLIIIAILLILILVVGYEIAPSVNPSTGGYLLEWLKG